MTARIVPYIRYEDCKMAVRWLYKVFEFERNLIVPGDTGEIIHAQLVSGQAMIMLGDGQADSSVRSLSRSPTQLEGFNTSSIYMFVEDVDIHYEKTKAAGADIVLDIKEEDYGGRGYTCKDLEGHLWSFGSYYPWK